MLGGWTRALVPSATIKRDGGARVRGAVLVARALKGVSPQRASAGGAALCIAAALEEHTAVRSRLSRARRGACVPAEHHGDAALSAGLLSTGVSEIHLATLVYGARRHDGTGPRGKPIFALPGFALG